MAVKVGCCGFALAQARYYARFPVVEVQQTFYHPPELRTVERWRAQAPAAFEFTVKAWQLITHEPSSPTYRRLRQPIPIAARNRYGGFRLTAEVEAAWARTREVARALKARVILFQCPAAFTPTAENRRRLRRFFEQMERDGFILVWEPRGNWTPEEIRALCRELDLVHGGDPFQLRPDPGRIQYFRLHGRTGYRYRFTDADLQELARICRREGTTYCLFNNLTMADDARRFQELLGA